jgi:hypothetical protein
MRRDQGHFRVALFYEFETLDRIYTMTGQKIEPCGGLFGLSLPVL